MPHVDRLAGTRKGAFILRADRSRRKWEFVNREQARELSLPLRVYNEVQIICALSGG